MKYITLTCLLLFSSYHLLAQQISITGQVTDQDKEPLIGVTVSVKGANIAVMTDIDGRYTIQAEQSDELTLVFFYIGFQTNEVLVAGRTTVDVAMGAIVEAIDELVVVGYGRSSIKELTGATAKVDGEDVEKLNTSRLDQALQGQIAGVSISTNSGSPGGSSAIRIRGLSTFGDNDPLILVDGIVYDSEGLNALNPSDIASVNVLKDATAGIYGVRAANGVILIETKTGSLDKKPEFEFRTYYGIQQTANKLSLLNAEEYAVIKNQMFAFGGQTEPFNNTALGVGTNWQRLGSQLH